MMTLTRGLAAMTLCSALAAPAFAEGRDPYKYFFNDTFGDFKDELQNARAQGKKGVFIFFEMDECPFCHFMKENILDQPEVQAYFRENFLSFPVDIEGGVEVVDFNGEHVTQKQFATRNRVRATPVLGFFDLDGKPMTRYTGRTADVAEFMLLGRYVAEGQYQNTPFVNFKRNPPAH